MNTNTNVNELTVFYTNVRSLRTNFDMIKLCLYNSRISYHIIILSETWVSKHEFDMYNLVNYTGVIQERCHGRSGGIAVFVRNDLICSFKKYADKNHESILIKVKSDHSTLNLLCTYRNCNSSIYEYMNFLETMKGQFDILLGDINQNILSDNHDVIHGDSFYYMQYLEANGYISRINVPTRVSDVSKTCIDHCFAKPHVGNVVTKILDDIISDHKCIQINISKNVSKDRPQQYTFCDLRLVKSELALHDWNQLLLSDDVDIIYNEIKDTIACAIENATETVRITQNNRKRKEWINTSLIQKINRKNHLYKLCQKYPFDTNIKAEFTLINRELKIDIKRAKNSFYAERFQNTQNSKDFWKLAKNVINGGNNSLKNRIKCIEIDEQSVDATENEVKIANHFNSYFGNIAKKILDENDIDNNRMPDCNELNYSMYFSPIKLHEVDNVIKELKNKKTTGFDNISCELLKYCKDELLSPIYHLCHVSLSQGRYPEALKLSVVIPLHKEGCTEMVENYRPLYLNSTVGKILENVVQKRIMKYLESINFCSANQYAFQKKSGTEKALYNYILPIVEGLEKNQRVAACHIDIKKCFDVIDRQILLKKIECAGIRGNILKWIKSYLSNRTQITKINGKFTSSTLPLDYGILQGSGMAPLFFLIFINDLCKLNLPSDCELIVFADDTGIVATADTAEKLRDKIEMSTNQVMQWLKEHRMIPNWKKTNIIEFTYNYNTFQPIADDHIICHIPDCLRINCTCPKIKIVKTVKYLGLYVDQNLSWRTHIDNLSNRLRQINTLIYNIRGYMSNRNLLMIYHAHFQSRLQYALPIWGGANTTTIGKIVICQKFVMRTMFKKDRRFHTKELFQENKVLPVSILYRKCMLKFFVNNVKNNANVIIRSHDTREGRINLICPPNYRKERSRKSVIFNSIAVYNTFVRFKSRHGKKKVDDFALWELENLA